MSGGKIIQSVFIFISIVSIVGIESCKKDNGNEVPPTNPAGKLELITETEINVSEPSGLAFGPNNKTLLVVSDNTNKVYETDLEGTVTRELDYTGNDLEGITFNPNDETVAVAEERKRQLVILNYSDGAERERFEIATGGNTENKGLEGLSFNTNNRAYYLMNEDLPGEMIVWSNSYGIISSTELNFAADYSGIFVDARNAFLYIISDESQSLYKCDYNATVIKKYPLPLTKFEGVVIDTEKQLVYMVNDKTAKLYIFKLLN